MSFFDLPDVVKNIIPNSDTPIWDILQYQLPAVAKEPPDSPFIPTTALIPSPANTSADPLLLISQPTAPERFLYGLQGLIAPSDEGGDKSVRVPWFPEELGCVGLWIVKYWEQIAYLRWVQGQWEPRLNWLVEQRTNDMAFPAYSSVYDQAIHSLKFLYAGEKLSIQGRLRRGEDLEHVAYRLLARRWLSNDVIDHMLDVLGARPMGVDSSDLSPPYLLFSTIQTALVGALENARMFEREYTPPKAANQLRAWIDGGGQSFLFVLNINNNHWVAGCADISKRLIRIGDSLRISHGVRSALEPIQTWLCHCYGQEFQVQSDLPAGKQIDGTSCGLFSVNTLAMHAFGDPPLTHEMRNLARASAFLDIVSLHLRTINRHHTLQFTKFGSEVEKPLLESGAIPSDDNDAAEELNSDFGDGLMSFEIPADNGAEKGWYRGENGETETEDEVDGVVGQWMDSRVNHEPGEHTNDESTGDEIGWSERVDGALGASTESLIDLDTRLQLHDEVLDPKAKPGTPLGMPIAGTSGTKRKSTRRDTVSTPEVDKTTPTESRDSSDEDQEIAKPRRKRTKRLKTAVYDKKLKDSLAAGTFERDPKRWGAFTKTILKLDKYAAFDKHNIQLVRHSVCGQWLKVHLPYQVRDFKNHVNRFDCSKKTGKAALPSRGMALLSRYGFTEKSSSPSTPSAPPGTLPVPATLKHSPCRGLKELDHPGVAQYIGRTSYLGGGSHSVSHYARRMFSTEYRNLGAHQKREVSAQSYQDQQWRVAHIDQSVYSTACLQTVEHHITSPSPPCTSCLSLLDDSRFKTALRRPIKPAQNLKFTNARYLNPSAALVYASTKGVAELLQGDDKKTVAARFAAKILMEPESERTVFFGLIQAVLMRKSKEARGVSLENSRYESSYDDLCHMILAHSPSAYHTFRIHFPARSPSSFRAKRSREFKFPLSINEHVFELAKVYVTKTGYVGPLCLSCDDTKLLPSLRPYYDSRAKNWKVVGGTEGPIIIADNDELLSTLRGGKVEKATKVRLWVLQIPLQGIAPLAVAALPLASNVPASKLAEYLKTILDGLLDVGLQVISYASDGSAVEQSVQATIFNSGDYQEYRIPFSEQSNAPMTASPDLETTFRLGFYRQKPLIMIQDSKHALKTCRNNLFSGARLLVLGNHVVHYSQVREIAFDNNSTLFHRDVEKLDRQDDQAASRLFSAGTLDFITKHRPQYLALTVYLFIFGELCDAYQSRHTSHADRFRMAMRAHYFLKYWENFLRESGYSLARYFISPAAYNILSTVINGLVLLILVYRDHLDSPHPLLPWLHSTEACEHMFGELRKLIPDFTYYDTLHAMPKLRLILRASYEANHITKLAASKNSLPKKSTGYQHTCIDYDKLDLSMLSTFPTSAEMGELDAISRIEAANLARALGVEVPNLSAAPVISTFLNSSDVAQHFGTGSTSEWAVDEQTEDASALEVLDECINTVESGELPLDSISRPRDNVIYALSALEVEHSILIDDLPSETDEHVHADRVFIDGLLADLRPQIQIPDINELLFDAEDALSATLDPQLLVTHRLAHQTRQASKSTKNFRRHLAGKETDPLNNVRAVNQHAELARVFAQTLRDEESVKLSNRATRWASVQNIDIKLTGNAANAKQAADKKADTYVASRRTCLHRNGVRELLDDLSHARITSIKPLDVSDFAWVLSGDKVELGRVLCVYTKEGGKYGNHSSVPHAPHLGLISYVGMQIFERVPGAINRFRATRTTPTQESHRFQHTHVNELLMIFTEPGVITSNTGEFIQFTPTSRHLSDLQILTKTLGKIKSGLNHLSKLKTLDG